MSQITVVNGPPPVKIAFNCRIVSVAGSGFVSLDDLIIALAGQPSGLSISIHELLKALNILRERESKCP